MIAHILPTNTLNNMHHFWSLIICAHCHPFIGSQLYQYTKCNWITLVLQHGLLIDLKDIMPWSNSFVYQAAQIYCKRTWLHLQLVNWYRKLAQYSISLNIVTPPAPNSIIKWYNLEQGCMIPILESESIPDWFHFCLKSELECNIKRLTGIRIGVGIRYFEPEIRKLLLELESELESRLLILPSNQNCISNKVIVSSLPPERVSVGNEPLKPIKLKCATSNFSK